jgi:hypothetical protein
MGMAALTDTKSSHFSGLSDARDALPAPAFAYRFAQDLGKNGVGSPWVLWAVWGG